MRLFLIRHGQTTANVAHELDTALPGAPLTDMGRHQAASLPVRLAQERFDGIWCSRAQRAKDTAAALAEGTGHLPQVMPGLHEIQAGDLEMSADRSAWQAYLQLLEQWIRGDLTGSVPGGESGAQAIARFDADVAAIEQQAPRQAAIVAHGAIIRLWSATRAVDADREFVIHHPLKNTGYVVLNGTLAQGWSLEAWHGDLPLVSRNLQP
ncbi:histidine phosphatase family protein [Branchiibius sp. NY16-3462-2]|uniref:histidine phosphatase family protein n=1 Tax=Branchiibius sp. NY16-3462-2 TaxID=1807500 RepID=UPI00079CAC62|nr:histidine phosphatase family protein [Branchiibius sp. NY16-3462-2]KYH43386.1 hypothetical protein AZH51_16635 [Branchiibius sp. NY16-3462-2]